MFTASSAERCSLHRRCDAFTASLARLRPPVVTKAPLLSPLCPSLPSLIDRRGFIRSDSPQLAPPTNGITMYGATQSQQSHMVRSPNQPAISRPRFSGSSSEQRSLISGRLSLETVGGTLGNRGFHIFLPFLSGAKLLTELGGKALFF